ncbi:hypothetical protein SAMN05660420_02862 [Desulfuromusa kysingii]|uniref:Uncharacterized protein n=1 Tax=Desulfuromusa kysingii TaxID=37625 RepID=A0A1H4D7C5_9BACT|nr:hypothetical protein [Desulfuromusa kysingii]SEA68309.1 hypothetical protein SAMN05660420_02862 [Desulfuromusa kysingii]
MSEHLWPLLRLKAESDTETKEVYFKKYLETYVRSSDGQEIEIVDWQGNRIFFNAHFNSFDHAFTENKNYRHSHGVHSKKICKNRARRLLWIKETLKGEVGTIERRQEFRKDGRGRMKKRRTLVVLEERYVVVLEERNGRDEYDFVSAFPADENYLRRIRKNSTLLETKKPQS